MHRRVLVASLAAVVAAVLAVGGCSRPTDPPAAQGTAGDTVDPTTAPTPTSRAASEPSGTGPVQPTTSSRRPAPVRYRFPVAGCRAQYGRAHHDYPASDLFTARGCAFVAPVAGRVDEVERTDRWSSGSDRGADRGGRSVSLIGVDGVRYYGSHLEAVAPEIVPGARVRAGQLLGRIGNTGSARGVAVHLHFGISWPTRPGIWWVRRGMVSPASYLDAWRAGADRSPARAVRAARAAAGREVPPCRARC